MQRDTVRQVAVVVAIAITLVVNGLAETLPINGLTTKEISDRFSIYFVPADYVFSIWGLIYLGLILFAVYQALPNQRENPRLRRVGPWVVLSCLANSAWIFFWHYELFSLTIVAMVVLLASLIAIYLSLGIGRTSVALPERWFVRVPFSLYLGWVTVAAVANTTQFLEFIGWHGWGLSEEVWAVIMLVAATIIAGSVALTRRDVAYMLVIIWAFVGIAVKHAAVPLVSTAAWITTGANVALLVVGALLRRRC